jgi:hypothetical protein
MTRREMLCHTGMGFGALALGGLMADAGLLAPAPARADATPGSSLAPKAPQFAPKAKRVIHLFMNGGPSQVDTFDPKPALTKYAGQALPQRNLPTERKTGAAFGSPFSFRKYGQSGIEVSEIFAKVGACIDDICVIRSMHADVPNHEPSLMLMNCGDARQARPSVGSWVLYGLGTENQNLPRLRRHVPRRLPDRGVAELAGGFLPGVYQGHVHRHPAHRHREADRAHQATAAPPGAARPARPALQLNREHRERRQRDAQLEARIQSFELAYRMQTEAATRSTSPGAEHVRELYGPASRPGSA